MQRILLAAALIGFAQVAWSELKDGALAYSRGDFAAAVRELRPLADQGNAMPSRLHSTSRAPKRGCGKRRNRATSPRCAI
jgi:hypothetical protein